MLTKLQAAAAQTAQTIAVTEKTRAESARAGAEESARAGSMASQSQLLSRADNTPGDAALMLARDAFLTVQTANPERGAASGNARRSPGAGQAR